MTDVKKSILTNLNAGIRKPFTGNYPKAIGYSDKYSVRNNASVDLLISYANLIVSRSAPINTNDGILVTARKEGGLLCFAGVVANELYSKPKIWEKEGGQVWEYNYEIVRVSDVVYLETGTVEALVGYRLRNLLQFAGVGKMTANKTVMIAVGSVWRYLYENEKNLSQDIVDYDNIDDLISKFV